MKKTLIVIFAILLVGVIFTSCNDKKSDVEDDAKAALLIGKWQLVEFEGEPITNGDYWEFSNDGILTWTTQTKETYNATWEWIVKGVSFHVSNGVDANIKELSNSKLVLDYDKEEHKFAKVK